MLPVSTACFATASFWALRHALWCGWTLRNLLALHPGRKVLVLAAAAASPASPHPPALHGLEAALVDGPVLLAELVKEEGAEQLAWALDGAEWPPEHDSNSDPGSRRPRTSDATAATASTSGHPAPPRCRLVAT